jgi:hypothetical protein
MEAPLRGPEYQGLDGGLACDAAAFCAPLRAFDAAKGLSNALFPRISPSETRQVFWLRGLRMKKV